VDRVTRFKEAVKTGLALMLVYGIALKVNWMNPYWAGWAVAMISLSTAGESIHKGMLRLAGTIPGCISALVILSLAPQSRWLLLLLMCTWIFLTTYMMLVDKQHSYFWNVAGFVSLIILVTGPSSSANLFTHAVYRTVETGMGVVVYTLVTVFLWPRTNLGAIKKTGGMLTATQAALFQAGREVMTDGTTDAKLSELHGQEVQQLARFAQVLQAEGSESYEVREMRHVWNRFHGLSAAVMESLDRWQTGIGDLAGIDVNAALPDLPAFFDELGARFAEIQGLLGGHPPALEPATISLAVDHNALKGVLKLDLAALAVTRQELIKLERLTRSMLGCVRDLMGESARAAGAEPAPFPSPRSRGFTLPVLDPDFLRGATYVAVSTAVGFLIWITINPPGHTGWFQFVGAVAMAVAAAQQLKATVLAKSIGLASAIGLLAYVFIMPQLSTFVGLGALLFIAAFVVCYFFTGLARLAGMIGIINEISVSNPQSYNFAAMANGLFFTIAALLFIYAMSYMLRSPRPEKAVLQLVHRFFRSTAFLVARLEPDPRRSPTFMERWLFAFHRRELQTLPAKITAWGRAIDRTKFPANTPEQVQGLVTSLQTLVYRLDALHDAGDRGQAASLTRALGEDIQAWRTGMEETFMKWSRHPDADATVDLQGHLANWIDSLEARIEAVLAQTDTTGFSSEEEQHFFRLLGGIRGVTAAAIGCAGIAGTIDWKQWREERF